jgi:periplasmic mercuric ion binding protein
MKQAFTLLMLLTVTATPAWAAPKTTLLSVPGMNCVACPVTVKLALTKTPGVAKAEVKLDKRQVLVSFDDTKTNVVALMQATSNAGYPSNVIDATP